MDPQNLDLAQFQSFVESELRMILYCEELQNLDPEELRPFGAENPSTTEARRQAEEQLQHPELKKRICAILQSMNRTVDDVFEFAKVLSPPLCAAVITGQIVIPLYPTLFAWMALILFRRTVEVYCAEEDPNPDRT